MNFASETNNLINCLKLVGLENERNLARLSISGCIFIQVFLMLAQAEVRNFMVRNLLDDQFY